MDTIAGVFNSQAEAEQVLNQLNRLNLEADRLRVLHQGTVEESRSLLTPFAVALTPGGDELSSALTSFGLSEADAEFYSQELEEDSVIVMVKVDADRRDEALAIMRQANAVVRE